VSETDSDPDRDAPSLFTARAVALLEVLICSGYPTQLAIGGTVRALGYTPFDASGGLTSGYVVRVSLADAVLVVALAIFFLRAHGERARDVILGRRSLLGEAAFGVPLIFVALGVAISVLLLVQMFAPWLHTVARNPIEGVLQSRREAALFALVVVVAGGIREEVQRAFILHRFDQWLGGGTLGVVISSVAFGAGHWLQGPDIALATGLLGAMWGVIYLRRRSAVAPIVSHAGFDLLQILQFVLTRSVAGR
jgi:membrane protease YdiL (CAAX protease family)